MELIVGLVDVFCFVFEGDGMMFDNMVIVYLFDYGDWYYFLFVDWLMVMLGFVGGKLRMGWYL